jgi:hypothetical protein
MAIEVERSRRFTADEYERMVSLGIFREDERLELIDGEIVQMAPVGHRHAACIANLNERFVTGVRERALVWCQGPARLSIDSVPEPDFALLRRRSQDGLSEARRRPADCRGRRELTALRPDDEAAAVRSGRSGRVLGRQRGWRVDRGLSLAGGDGYRERRRVGIGERIAPAVFADVSIDVGEVFA